ncbi:MAG: trimethylamine methyltransferase family protein [Thiolinea sp.]
MQGERVYLDRGLIRELISSIPEHITLHARDPDKSVALGGAQSIFVPMTGAPFIADLENKAALADPG